MTNSIRNRRPPTCSFTGRHCCLSVALEALDPAYFGFVASTGIVPTSSSSCVLIVARSLAVFNIACYALLLALFTVRTAAFPKCTLADLRNRDRHWGTLTFIAATNTVGVQFRCSSIPSRWRPRCGVTIVATPLLLYYLFVTEIIGAGKAGVSERIDGAFLLIDRLHAVARGPRRVARRTIGGYGNAVVLLSMSYFGSGYVLYFVVVTVVTYRLSTARSVPRRLTGPYWITMGAAAITTLAGTTLGPRLETFQGWEPYAPVIIGVTFTRGAIASWVDPLLLVVDIWKFLTGGTDGKPPAWVLLFRGRGWDSATTCLPAHVRADGVGRVSQWDVHRQYAEYRRDRDIRSPLRRSRVLGLVRAGGGALTLVGMSRAFGRVLLTSDPTEELARESV